MAERTTINDVAKKAQVSVGTVHRALYGKPGVSEIVRKRILNIAHEMGYQPNRVASSLRKKPLHIAVAFPEPSEMNRFFYGELWNGCGDCEDLLRYHNASVIEVPYKEDRADSFASNMGRVLLKYNNSIDGVLVGGKMRPEDLALVANITRPPYRIPLIAVGENFDDIDCLCSIQSDHATDGSMAAELLCAQLPPEGSILIAAGYPELRSNTVNTEAFLSFVMAHEPERKVYTVTNAEDGKDITEQIYACIAEHPDIVGLYSVSARGTLHITNAAKRFMPQRRFKIVGSDLYRESAGLLRQGIIQYIIYKNPRNQARAGIQSMLDYLIWGNVPGESDQRLTSLIICRSNLDKYYSKDQDV